MGESRKKGEIEYGKQARPFICAAQCSEEDSGLTDRKPNPGGDLISIRVEIGRTRVRLLGRGCLLEASPVAPPKLVQLLIRSIYVHLHLHREAHLRSTTLALITQTPHLQTLSSP
jgi:hypothetical protein